MILSISFGILAALCGNKIAGISPSSTKLVGIALLGAIAGYFTIQEPILPYWILLTFLFAFSLTDLDSQTAPDEITLGGATIAFLLAGSCASPLDYPTIWENITHAALGGVGSAAIILAISFVGKIMMGGKTIRFDPPQCFTISENKLSIDNEDYNYQNLFSNGSGNAWAKVTCENDKEEKIILQPEGISREHKKIPLEGFKLSGKIHKLFLPTDVMGLGDVKIMLMIGAFLGLQGGIFTIFAGATLGAICGIAVMKNGRIPFGPFLAIGAILWISAGPRILELAGW